MIQTRALVKRYGSFTAVNGIDLSIHPGEIYGFLGPNGAGKTSTIMMLLGITRPTSGEMLLFGEHYGPHRLDLRRRIGMVPEKHPRGIWPWITAREYLRFFADLFEITTPEESDPDILLLDEPISGLDPIGIKQVRDLILSENREGRTIFIFSHQLSEMEKVCHRVAIISQGRLMAEDSMGSLLSRLTRDREIHVDLESIPPKLERRMKSLPSVLDCIARGNTLIVKVPKEGDFRKVVSEFLIGQSLVPLRIQEKTLSLEEAFITITQENVETLTTVGGRQ